MSQLLKDPSLRSSCTTVIIIMVCDVMMLDIVMVSSALLELQKVNSLCRYIRAYNNELRIKIRSRASQ